MSLSGGCLNRRQLDLKLVDEFRQLPAEIDDAATGRREISRFLDDDGRVL